MTKHFTLPELTYSRIAIENGIDNTPGEAEAKALRRLATHVLEPLREALGAPIAITSGYRCTEVNRLAGGVADSQHTRGEAADCYSPLGARLLMNKLVNSGISFDQAILYRKKNFLHVSYRSKGVNRGQVLYQ